MSSLQWRSSGMTTPPAPQLTRRNGVGVVFDGMRAGNDQPPQYTLLQQQVKGGLRRGHASRHNVNN